jgi:transcription elongation factor Elf1
MPDLPECPYCGAFELDYYGIKDRYILTCGKCGRNYRVRVVKSIDYETEKLELDHLLSSDVKTVRNEP